MQLDICSLLSIHNAALGCSLCHHKACCHTLKCNYFFPCASYNHDAVAAKLRACPKTLHGELQSCYLAIAHQTSNTQSTKGVDDAVSAINQVCNLH